MSAIHSRVQVSVGHEALNGLPQLSTRKSTFQRTYHIVHVEAVLVLTLGSHEDSMYDVFTGAFSSRSGACQIAKLWSGCGAAVLTRPLQHLEMAAVCRSRARVHVPRAAVLARPLQHLEVAALCRVHARRLVPRAVVFMCPPQQM